MSALHDLATRALHLIDPETAHRLTIRALALGCGPRAAGGDDPVLATELFGHKVPNPIGLAAGFDKNAEVPDEMLAAGFGLVEVGSVTPLPQAGNPRPRLFRLAEDAAVINRMGFNNEGLDRAAARLIRRRARPGLVGVNIGANKDAPDRVADYVTGFRRVASLAGYVVVNVSSPNTPGLRLLQQKDELARLLAALEAARREIAAVPLVLKIAPDLAPEDCADIAGLAIAHGLDGLIVSNTTLARPESLRSVHSRETGGLSGRPLMTPSTALLAEMRRLTAGRLILIGAGGISSGADAYAKIRAGAAAVQLYSALVYQGPGLVGRIKAELAALLKADGWRSVAEAVGAGA
ncbi:MAG: quinone-dependent dihydroorotate dehydrogenase [Alphaproteobacteria bacterium]|jgi:dihydroorotate dehydrogenase|nr:quinone-dependent dihydroorotate dehydrogenase [Alphaproteobacteria bacterium]